MTGNAELDRRLSYSVRASIPPSTVSAVPVMKDASSRPGQHRAGRVPGRAQALGGHHLRIAHRSLLRRAVPCRGQDRAGQHVVPRSDIGTEEDRLPALGPYLAGDLPAPGLIDVGDADRGAFTRQDLGGGPADPGSGAGNDGRLAGDSSRGANGWCVLVDYGEIRDLIDF